MTAFDVLGPLPVGRVSLEASAGTGKTWTIASLVVRYVAEGVASIDQLLVATFTRAATAELRDRIRTRLTTTVAHLRSFAIDPTVQTDDPVAAQLAAGTVTVPVDAIELATRIRRLDLALADIDAALISTIHGFAQQVLRSVGFSGDIDGGAELVEDVDDLLVGVGRDALVRLYAEESDLDITDAMPSENDVSQVTIETMRHPRASLEPQPDDPTAPGPARELGRVAQLVARDVEIAKSRRGVMTFDDLLHRLARTLRAPAAREAVLETFRARFRVALIDEAQDTDPVQWEILETLFGDQTMILIGDPKQAIYRFRGADVAAYVAAVSQPGTDKQTLTTNHRSDESLVRAVNALFADTTFGDARIAHHPVQAEHPDRCLLDPSATAALQVRVIAADAQIAADTARHRIARDLAAEVTRLLASGATIMEGEVARPLVARDIAVLIRANATAAHIEVALRAADVPYVVAGVGSVFETPAGVEWMTLLAALAAPSRGGAARAVARSPFMGRSARHVASFDDEALEDLHGRLHHWAAVLRGGGVASLLRAVNVDAGMGSRLLGEVGGERLLTDIEHIGELLHASGMAVQGSATMAQWLSEQRHRVRASEVPADQRARRLESDSDAVQVMTIHGAKGLEFPIVFLPYMMYQSQRPSVPFMATDNGASILELGGLNVAEHKDVGLDAERAEALRLAYVAFTRARHRCVTWWWPSQGPTARPLSKLVVRRTADSSVTAASNSGRLDGLEVALDRLATTTDGAFGWVPVPATPRPLPVVGRTSDHGPLAVAPFQRDIDQLWTRTSYSALTRPTPFPSRGAMVAAGSPPDGPGSDTPGGDAPDGDGATTTARNDDHDQTVVAEASDQPGGLPLPLADMFGGARVGTLVHDIYEHVDFAAADVDDQIGDRFDRLVGPDTASALGLDRGALVAGLGASLRTPLGPGFGDLTLAGLVRRDRIDELAFELPVAIGSVGSGSTMPAWLDLHAVREVFIAHLASDDPMAGYADRLEDPALARRVRGHLSGFIDLVARRKVDGNEIFHVVDYKTNMLYGRQKEPTTRNYRHEALVPAMHHAHYPLQAALYAVAVHRLLRWRLPGYDPAVNLGAIGYLFVRGMVGPDTPTDATGRVAGVMCWQPPASFVVALSDLLHHGRTVAA